jgi:hypothetical protein
MACNFSDGGYRKLALHFTINDLSHAMTSVDSRMIDEMRMGKMAVESGDVVEVIYANAGGPYGSEVLGGVQEDSDRVWEEVVMGGGGGRLGLVQAIRRDRGRFRRFDRMAVSATSTLSASRGQCKYFILVEVHSPSK